MKNVNVRKTHNDRGFLWKNREKLLLARTRWLSLSLSLSLPPLVFPFAVHRFLFWAAIGDRWLQRVANHLASIRREQKAMQIPTAANLSRLRGFPWARVDGWKSASLKIPLKPSLPLSSLHAYRTLFTWLPSSFSSFPISRSQHVLRKTVGNHVKFVDATLRWQTSVSSCTRHIRWLMQTKSITACFTIVSVQALGFKSKIRFIVIQICIYLEELPVFNDLV